MPYYQGKAAEIAETLQLPQVLLWVPEAVACNKDFSDCFFKRIASSIGWDITGGKGRKQI